MLKTAITFKLSANRQIRATHPDASKAPNCSPIYVKSAAKAAKVVRTMVPGKVRDTERQLYLVFLDDKSNLIAFKTMPEYGAIDSGQLNFITSSARLFYAKKVIILHNSNEPYYGFSDMDLAFTEKVCQALNGIKVKVLDHVIVAANAHLSLVGCGYGLGYNNQDPLY